MWPTCRVLWLPLSQFQGAGGDAGGCGDQVPPDGGAPTAGGPALCALILHAEGSASTLID